MLTPEGRLARYLYGIEYAPKDLRLAVVEAADGKIGGFAEQLLLLCFHYDANLGKYSAVLDRRPARRGGADGRGHRLRHRRLPAP